MEFCIKNKVALVTGGAQGIGLQIIKHLFSEGLRGVTIIDVNDENGNKAVKDLTNEYGANKCIYCKADVQDVEQLEDAFQKTIKTFNNLDIIINNAGIMNDAKWSEEIGINVIGVTNGIVLGLEKYLPKYRSGAEGIIISTASIAGVSALPMFPIYCGTKHAVIGMTRAFGHEDNYNRTKIRVMAVCPGYTNTPMLQQNLIFLGDEYKKMCHQMLDDMKQQNIPNQDASFVADLVIKVIEKGKSGSIWIAEENEYTYEYVMPQRQTMRKNCLEC